MNLNIRNHKSLAQKQLQFIHSYTFYYESIPVPMREKSDLPSGETSFFLPKTFNRGIVAGIVAALCSGMNIPSRRDSSEKLLQIDCSKTYTMQ